jgi:hypothetical protein
MIIHSDELLPVASTPAACSSRSAITGELPLATSNSSPPTWEPSANSRRSRRQHHDGQPWLAHRVVGRFIDQQGCRPPRQRYRNHPKRSSWLRLWSMIRLAAKQREHGSDHRPQMSCPPRSTGSSASTTSTRSTKFRERRIWCRDQVDHSCRFKVRDGRHRLRRQAQMLDPSGGVSAGGNGAPASAAVAGHDRPRV